MSVKSKVLEMNTGTTNSSSIIVITKKFDLGVPDLQKRFSKMTLTYKAASTVLVQVILDTVNFQSTDTIITFPSNSYLTPVTRPFGSVAKVATFKLTTSAADFELDSFEVEYEIIGGNP